MQQLLTKTDYTDEISAKNRPRNNVRQVSEMWFLDEIAKTPLVYFVVKMYVSYCENGILLQGRELGFSSLDKFGTYQNRGPQHTPEKRNRAPVGGSPTKWCNFMGSILQ